MRLSVHPKPRNDEILSSWLVRIAMAQGMKVHSFCVSTLPGKAVWNRDIDKLADDDLIDSLSTLTATDTATVRNTTLSSSEGYIYENHNKYGPTQWILPVGIYHRKRVSFGMQYCPLCLSEDAEPYFRKRWRFAFMTICEIHGIPLKDRCENCSSPINFHRNELGRFHKYTATSLTNCSECETDLRESSASSVDAELSVTESEIAFTEKLVAAANDGYYRVSKTETVYSLFFFKILNQLMKTCVKNDSRIRRLRSVIDDRTKQSFSRIVNFDELNSRTDIQEQSLPVRRALLSYASYLLEEWSSRFVEISIECGIWSSMWLKNLEEYDSERSHIAPYWFSKVVREQLYRRKYHPSAREIEEATRYLLRNHSRLSKSSVSRLLGATYLRSDFNIANINNE